MFGSITACALISRSHIRSLLKAFSSTKELHPRLFFCVVPPRCNPCALPFPGRNLNSLEGQPLHVGRRQGTIALIQSHRGSFLRLRLCGGEWGRLHRHVARGASLLRTPFHWVFRMESRRPAHALRWALCLQIQRWCRCGPTEKRIALTAPPPSVPTQPTHVYS